MYNNSFLPSYDFPQNIISNRILFHSILNLNLYANLRKYIGKSKKLSNLFSAEFFIRQIIISNFFIDRLFC